MKNYLIGSIREVTNKWLIQNSADIGVENKSRLKILADYEAMYQLSRDSARDYLEGDWEEIKTIAPVTNAAWFQIAQWYAVKELWYREQCNILAMGADTLFVKPTRIFGEFEEMRIFNFTDPQAHPDMVKYNQKNAYFNDDIRYFPATMDPKIWELGESLMQKWLDHNEASWAWGQLKHNHMFWSQGISLEQAHQPQLAWQFFNNNQQYAEKWNRCPASSAHIIHFHGSRGSENRVQVMTDLREKTKKVKEMNEGITGKDICRICKNQLKQKFKFDNVPGNVQQLYQNKEQVKTNNTDFSVYQCNQCGLVQAPLKLEEDYYDDYLMSQTFSKKMRDYLDQMTEHFVTEYLGDNERVIDIGAGDGAFMMPFAKRAIEVHGIEPSKRSRDAAKENGFDVYPGYVSADTKIPNAPYTAFVSRQVFEHIDDIAGVIEGIKQNTTDNAVGMIEVPSLEIALKDNRFYDFFPDHVNYFSQDTLRLAFEINGFDVLESFHALDDEYNVVIVRRRPSASTVSLEGLRADLVREIETLAASQAGSVAIWGTGAKGLSIMSAMDCTNIAGVIDSDPNKLGRFVPSNGLQVEGDEAVHKYNCVIITALAYKDVIKRKLVDMNFEGTVYVVGNSGLEIVE